MTTKEGKEKIWKDVLVFLAGEWFGPEVVSEFINHKMAGDQVREGEKKINCDLDEHEKIFWDFVDTTFNHLRKNRKKLPAGDLEEKKRMAGAIKTIFWAMIQLNHPEFMEAENIGIRENYTIIEAPPAPMNPLAEILKGNFN